MYYHVIESTASGFLPRVVRGMRTGASEIRVIRDAFHVRASVRDRPAEGETRRLNDATRFIAGIFQSLRTAVRFGNLAPDLPTHIREADPRPPSYIREFQKLESQILRERPSFNSSEIKC